MVEAGARRLAAASDGSQKQKIRGLVPAYFNVEKKKILALTLNDEEMTVEQCGEEHALFKSREEAGEDTSDLEKKCQTCDESAKECKAKSTHATTFYLVTVDSDPQDTSNVNAARIY